MCVIGIQVFSLSLMYIILPSRLTQCIFNPRLLSHGIIVSPQIMAVESLARHTFWLERERVREIKWIRSTSYKQRGHLVKVRSGTTRRWSSGERLKEWTIKWCLQEVHNARGHCHCPSQGNGTWFSPKDSPAKNGSHDNASRRLQCSRTGLEELSCR